MPGPLSNAHTVTKLPAQDLERARVLSRQARARVGRGAHRRPALCVRTDGVSSLQLGRNGVWGID
jgi:hypothetical protein